MRREVEKLAWGHSAIQQQSAARLHKFLNTIFQ